MSSSELQSFIVILETALKCLRTSSIVLLVSLKLKEFNIVLRLEIGGKSSYIILISSIDSFSNGLSTIIGRTVIFRNLSFLILVSELRSPTTIVDAFSTL